MTDRGVKYWPDGATTYSMVMRSRSGTVRWVEAEHRFDVSIPASQVASIRTLGDLLRAINAGR